MKTCETCKGTGQVPEIPKGGDIVEGVAGRVKGLLGVVIGPNTHNSYKTWGTHLFLDIKSGESYSFEPWQVRVRHGRIHIDR